MNTKHFTVCTIWLLLFAASLAGADESAVDGVFGLAPITENTSLAVWVPLAADESITGVMWYNNDGSRAFPEMLAVAGDSDRPELLNDAVVVGENVAGMTLGWSECTFEPALASATPGLYLIFRLPADGEFEAEGQGSGLGYQFGDGQVRCWISTEDGVWDPLSPEFQMAVLPIMNSDKSGDVIVLGRGDGLRAAAAGGDDSQPPVPLIPGLIAAPNPFNPQTEIQFTLPAGSNVKLTIYDVRGREVRTLVSGSLAAGTHAVVWNGRDGGGRTQASGVYLALLEAGPIRLTKRLTLVQ